jgi:hypothetical protein
VTAVDADYDGWAILDTSDPIVVADEADITSATTLREYDDIVHDPNDPNLGSFPEREYKCYFTAIVSSSERLYVAFSADGASWGTPVALTGADVATVALEDPSVVTMLGTRGQVYRDGSDKMYLYAERKAGITTIFAFESTNGIAWTLLADGDPAIDKGAGGAWDDALVGSPVARHDGTNFIVGFEGVDALPTSTAEGFGIAVGATADDLTKSANNPVWTSDTDPYATDSIVVDSFFLNDAEDAIYFLAHGRRGGSSTTNTMFRGKTSVLDPTLWEDGDIAVIGSRLSPILFNDLALDHSSGLARVVTGGDQDFTIVSYPLRIRALPAISPKNVHLSGSVAGKPWYFRKSGSWLRVQGALNKAIMDLSPAGYWRGSEQSGTTAVDSSGNGRDGTYSGQTLQGIAGPDGRDYATFAGASANGFTVADNDAWSIDSASGLTIFHLLRVDSNVVTQFCIAKEGSADSEWEAFVQATGTGEYQIRLRTAAAATARQTLTSSSPIASATWHAVIWTVASTSSYPALQVDDTTPTAATSNTSTAQGNSSNPLHIGHRPSDDGLPLDGSMPHVAIFPGVMGATNIQGLFDAAAADGWF